MIFPVFRKKPFAFYVALYTMLCALGACQRTTPNPVTPTDTTKTSSSTTLKHPFGALVNPADDVQPTTARRLSVLQALGASCVRDAILTTSWTGSSDRYDAFQTNNVKVVLNINTQQTGETVAAMPYTTDLAGYRTTVTAILNKYQPEMVVIENEEENDKYHVVEPDKYVALLRTAIEVAKPKKIKITNGGITARVATLLAWDDYYQRGLRTEAADFARRSMPSAIAADLPDMKKYPSLRKNLDQAKQLVAAYKTLDMDAVNFHWYEPIAQRENMAQTPDLPALTTVDTKALGEVIDYFARATGKPVVTNEIGTINRSSNIVQQVMQKTLDAKMSYVLWYSGDGGLGDAVALHNGDGSLRVAGTGFRDFIKMKFP